MLLFPLPDTGPETGIFIPRTTLQRLTVTVTSPVNVVFSRDVRRGELQQNSAGVGGGGGGGGGGACK